ncbi:MAG TPA: hypothetical protein VG742_20635, partial [Dongiaceae bacterium]|nr:hypothetical protein [Dongiaceae bacterium]
MKFVGQGTRAATAMLTVLSLTAFGAGSAWAASCPTVKDPQGLTGAWAEQVEVEEAAAKGVKLTYSENPLFDKDVKAGKLP